MAFRADAAMTVEQRDYPMTVIPLGVGKKRQITKEFTLSVLPGLPFIVNHKIAPCPDGTRRLGCPVAHVEGRRALACSTTPPPETLEDLR
jgi:hypothetical protein